MNGSSPTRAMPVSRRVSRIRTPLLVAALVVVGFALRTWQLGDIPFGFHTDEGHNALDALRIAAGWRPAFLPGNNGREPLFIYLIAACLGVLGPSIWAARLAGVVSGVLLIPAQYVFVRSLPLPRPGRTAVVAAALAATTFWPVAQARYALRAGLLPLWVTLILWAWWRAVDRGSTRHAVVAGVMLALAVHTHLTARLLPFVLLVSALWAAWETRRRRPWIVLAMVLAVAAVLSLPQITYFARQPEMLAYRADQVSVLNPDVNEGDVVGTLAANAWRLLRAPLWKGDSSWYHNLSGRPVFDPLVAIGFLVGLALFARDLASRRCPRAKAAAVFLVAASVVALVPSWLSVGAPNYVRLTATWPALFLVAAYGLDRLAAAGERRSRPGRWIVPAVLAVSAVWSAADYFARYSERPEVYEAFNGAAVDRGRVLAAVAAEGTTYVSPTIERQSVLRFLTFAQSPASFDPDAGLVLPPEGDARYAFEATETGATARFASRWPWFARSGVADRRAAPALTVFRAPADTWARLVDADQAGRDVAGDPAAFPATFGERIRLVGASIDRDTVHPGETLTVTLLLECIAPTEVDHNLFVHIEAGDGRSLGQFDGPPLGGSRGTDRWRPGERIVQPVGVPVPADVLPGFAEVRVGWYDWRDLEGLALPGSPDDAADVGTVRVVR